MIREAVMKTPNVIVKFLCVIFKGGKLDTRLQGFYVYPFPLLLQKKRKLSYFIEIEHYENIPVLIFTGA